MINEMKKSNAAKAFADAEIEVIKFNACDIVTTSDDPDAPVYETSVEKTTVKFNIFY